MHESPFPRTPDAEPHAWGLSRERPHEVWERFSARYESQAEELWNAVAALGLIPSLEWAGSQDGEALLGRDKNGALVVTFHLEDPKEAENIAKAISMNSLAMFVHDSI